MRRIREAITGGDWTGVLSPPHFRNLQPLKPAVRELHVPEAEALFSACAERLGSFDEVDLCAAWISAILEQFGTWVGSQLHALMSRINACRIPCPHQGSAVRFADNSCHTLSMTLDLVCLGGWLLFVWALIGFGGWTSLENFGSGPSPLLVGLVVGGWWLVVGGCCPLSVVCWLFVCLFVCSFVRSFVCLLF